MAIYYVPEWFLKFIAAMFALGLWYHSIVTLSTNLAANEPSRGFCSFIYDSWALSVFVYGGFYFVSAALNVSPFSDSFLALSFISSFIISVILLLPLIWCILK